MKNNQDGVFHAFFRDQHIVTVDIADAHTRTQPVHDLSGHPSTLSPV